MRISDWSSDVCSSDLVVLGAFKEIGPRNAVNVDFGLIGRNREVGIEGHRATRRRPGDRAIALDQLGQLALAYGGGHIDIIFLLGAGESAPPAIGGRVRQSLSDFLPTLRRAAMLRGPGGFRTLAIDMRQGGFDRMPQQMLEGHREIESGLLDRKSTRMNSSH